MVVNLEGLQDETSPLGFCASAGRICQVNVISYNSTLKLGGVGPWGSGKPGWPGHTESSHLGHKKGDSLPGLKIIYMYTYIYIYIIYYNII